MKTITAILTIYNRVDNLERQIKSLLNQSVKINQFIINVNNKQEKLMYDKIIHELIPEALIVEHSKNLGVWSRFFLTFNATTDFVFVVDDDIIPGSKYIENCITSYFEKPGIYGSWGSKFKSKTIRKNRDIISESDNIPNKITEVDMSGHSWFFYKNDLPKMFDRLPENINDYTVCGEELWVSYRSKCNGIKTYVPPMRSKEECGNLDPTLGHDRFAQYNKYGNNKYQEFYDYCIKDGFEPLLFNKI